MKKLTKTTVPKDETSRKKLRLGGYSVALICIVLAVLVAVNLIVGEIPAKYTQLDVSEKQIYTLSEESISYLKELEQDVTLYLITESGAEENNIYRILSKYESESSHISVQIKDPSLYPNFVSKYTSATLSDSSVIVESGDKSKVIDVNEIFAVDYNTYYSTGEVSYTYNGEALITGAINYVTREDLPTLYTITGHGEAALSETMQTAIENKNYTISELSLLSAEEIPEDCDVLLMNSPAQDISEEEADQLLDYLEDGGRLLLFTQASATELPNLMSVTESYGATMQNGMICDSDSEHYFQNYYMLLPDKKSHDITADQISNGTYTLFPIAHGISVLEQYRSTVTVSPLLETSSGAYLKADPQAVETFEKESGDTEGKFTLGVAIEENYNNANTRIAWYATSMANLEYYDSMISGANTELILSSLDWLNGGETAGVNVAAKSMDSEATMMLNASQMLIWITVMIIVIPVGLMVFGLVYWIKRRKR